jgi:ribonuclease HI
LSDFWDKNDEQPIHLKETQALINGIKSVLDVVRDHRVDAYVDNLACVQAWEKRYNPGRTKFSKGNRQDSPSREYNTISDQH